MLKNYRRIISSFMVVVMTFLLLAPTTVNARDAQQFENPSSIYSDSDALYYVCGENVPASLSKDLEDINITVEDNTLIEFVSSKNNDVADTMVVTNVDGSSMEKAFITSITSEGAQQSYSGVTDGNSWSASPMSDSFTLVMMVEYKKFSTDMYMLYYYQPVNVVFIYRDNNNLYTVKSIEVDYQCGGFEYNIVKSGGVITGYTPVTSGPEQYIHNITITKTSPSKNTYYGGNNPYNTNRAIDVSVGPDGSHMLFYDIYITPSGSTNVIHLHQALSIDQLN